jgi:Helix-turn-helix domain
MLVADGARRRGELTRAAIDVLRALLFKFANPKDGRCFPSHERLGEAAGCHARTVGRALKALERIRLVTWAHRLLRVAEPVAGLWGWVTTWRVIRTTNSYDFPLIAKNPGIPSNGQNDGGSPIFFCFCPHFGGREKRHAPCPDDRTGSRRSPIRASAAS